MLGRGVRRKRVNVLKALICTEFSHCWTMELGVLHICASLLVLYIAVSAFSYYFPITGETGI